MQSVDVLGDDVSCLFGLNELRNGHVCEGRNRLGELNARRNVLSLTAENKGGKEDSIFLLSFFVKEKNWETQPTNLCL